MFGSELISLGLTFNIVKNSAYDKLIFSLLILSQFYFIILFKGSIFGLMTLIYLFYISLIFPRKF